MTPSCPTGSRARSEPLDDSGCFPTASGRARTQLRPWSDHPQPIDPLEPVLRQAVLMHGLTDDAVGALIADMETMQADRGAVIVRQSDPDDYLYLVLSGKVKLTRCFWQGM